MVLKGACVHVFAEESVGRAEIPFLSLLRFFGGCGRFRVWSLACNQHTPLLAGFGPSSRSRGRAPLLQFYITYRRGSGAAVLHLAISERGLRHRHGQIAFSAPLVSSALHGALCALGHQKKNIRERRCPFPYRLHGFRASISHIPTREQRADAPIGSDGVPRFLGPRASIASKAFTNGISLAAPPPAASTAVGLTSAAPHANILVDEFPDWPFSLSHAHGCPSEVSGKREGS